MGNDADNMMVSEAADFEALLESCVWADMLSRINESIVFNSEVTHSSSDMLEIKYAQGAIAALRSVQNLPNILKELAESQLGREDSNEGSNTREHTHGHRRRIRPKREPWE